MTTSTVNSQATVTVSEPIKNKVTVLTLDTDWRDAQTSNAIIKTTTVYIQNGNPVLAEEPITDPVCSSTDEVIELDGFYQDLDPGRWVIVSGERSEVAGVRYSESALLASVVHGIKPGLPDEKLHTYIQFAEKLAYCFKRETIRIYGNVVKATHGESRLEVLGSGDGAKALQTFTLKQKPLTFVSAANPSGVDSSLKVLVNNIEWHEADSLAGLQANDRVFTSKTDNDDNTSVTFGNGKQGSRLPTGMENVRAQYRNGIGGAGNVRAEQISLLLTKPLGVKEVINPLRASGGADRETRDQARQHVPLAVKALDRLVSTQDYQDFARIYAGIGKAKAAELTNGRQPVLHVTVAGAGDIPIDETSDLFINLRLALHAFGDPTQFVQLAVRELLFIVVEAGVAILPDYQWESVVAEVRSRLLYQFSFERRELGQDVFLSEILSVMQSVAGVAYVDVDAFGGIPEKITEASARRLLTPDEIAEAVDCLATRWRAEDMDAACAGVTADSECDKYRNCKKYGHFGKTLGVRQWLQVNPAGFENGVIHPAQL
ncbi:MAG: putative baseplate assembly protein, partial [Methylomonas sp.]